MTEIANPKLEAIEQLVKRAIWDVVLEAQLAALFAAYPVLGVWPFRGILSGLAKILGDELFSGLKLVVDLHAIRLTNAEHQREFERAAVELRIIAYDHGIDSEEFKKAREHARETFSRFVRFGVAR